MRWDVLGARINISFGDNEYPRFFGRNYSRAEVIVSGADSTWVGETFAEIEEQVERTQVKGIYRTLGKALGSGFLSTVAGLVGLIVILSVLGTLMAASIGDKAPKLGYQVRQELLQKAKSASTVDDKVNFLVSWQTIALEESIKNDENTVGMVRYIFSKKSAYIVFPILLVLVCICYVGAKCCPGLVFEWGDWEDHYRQIVKRRGQIMMGVIVAFIVGVLGSLFASAF